MALYAVIWAGVYIELVGVAREGKASASCSKFCLSGRGSLSVKAGGWRRVGTRQGAGRRGIHLVNCSRRAMLRALAISKGRINGVIIIGIVAGDTHRSSICMICAKFIRDVFLYAEMK